MGRTRRGRFCRRDLASSMLTASMASTSIAPDSASTTASIAALRVFGTLGLIAGCHGTNSTSDILNSSPSRSTVTLIRNGRGSSRAPLALVTSELTATSTTPRSALDRLQRRHLDRPLGNDVLGILGGLDEIVCAWRSRRGSCPVDKSITRCTSARARVWSIDSSAMMPSRAASTNSASWDRCAATPAVLRQHQSGQYDRSPGAQPRECEGRLGGPPAHRPPRVGGLVDLTAQRRGPLLGQRSLGERVCLGRLGFRELGDRVGFRAGTLGRCDPLLAIRPPGSPRRS